MFARYRMKRTKLSGCLGHSIEPENGPPQSCGPMFRPGSNQKKKYLAISAIFPALIYAQLAQYHVGGSALTLRLTKVMAFVGIASVLALVVIPIMIIGWSSRAVLGSFSLLSSKIRNTEDLLGENTAEAS